MKKLQAEKSTVNKADTVLQDENILLTVQDNGMDKNSLDKIFEVYGRLNQNIEGNGVGLDLAKKIIHAAEGTTVVERAGHWQ